MTAQEIHQKLASIFSEHELQYDEELPGIIVPAAAVRDLALQLRDDEEFLFDFLMNLSGVDYGENTLGVVYHLYSMKLGHKVTLKVLLPVDNPHVVTCEKVWRTADWNEREAYDLFGIVFDGHRDLRRILMPYDWEGHPLRKDYETPEFYNGMKVPY